MEEELKPYSPIAKFICIKAILFFSFWQSVLIAGIAYVGVIPNQYGLWTKDHIARGIQDFIICVEMCILAASHPFVFSYKPYIPDDASHYFRHKNKVITPVKHFAKDVVNPKDVVKDIRVAYSPGNVKKARKEHKEAKRKHKEMKAQQEIDSVVPDTELESKPEEEDSIPQEEEVVAQEEESIPQEIEMESKPTEAEE
eukprot:TRINITY_DN4569_c0_g1_i1.p1 TRINITY_DN4569_c0_g1~~TRINITY_DN4569_c0_g1_i1.p1  ORF type:complete len:222 (-),score=74.95 TRINITY_DN4569_c0_g1_i1:37-630(-)